MLGRPGPLTPSNKGRKRRDEIRKRVWDELGITASVGVADNKIMAKLGSDLKKPDATTVLRPEDYERMVWPLPAKDLLMVGPSTGETLRRAGITTIGGIAQASPHHLKMLLWRQRPHALALCQRP